MKISDILNPSRNPTTTPGTETTETLYGGHHHRNPTPTPTTTTITTSATASTSTTTRLTSPPPSPHGLDAPSVASSDNYGKPRNRFSEYEDTVICQGVSKGLTWGQISGQLPHRKRATCFNRYRTLQGIRKSRKIKSMLHQRHYHYHHQDPMATTTTTTTTTTHASTFFTPSPSPPPPLTPPASIPCFHPTHGGARSNHSTDSISSHNHSHRHRNRNRNRSCDGAVLRLTPTSAFFGSPQHWPSAWTPSAKAVDHEEHHRPMYEKY